MTFDYGRGINKLLPRFRNYMGMTATARFRNYTGMTATADSNRSIDGYKSSVAQRGRQAAMMTDTSRGGWPDSECRAKPPAGTNGQSPRAAHRIIPAIVNPPPHGGDEPWGTPTLVCRRL